MKNPLLLLSRACMVVCLFTVLLTGCNSVKHSYQSGDFDKAVQRSVKKLKSDPKDEETITYLEAGYAKLNREAQDRIIFLKKEGRPENVLPVYDEMSGLRTYEDLIKPLLPLYISSKHRYASFNFIKDEDLITAKQNAAEYLYAYANKLLNEGDRLQARHAYDLYEQLACIYPNYKDAGRKMNDALAKGTNQVYLKIVNNSGAFLFDELEKQITSMPLGDLNAQWVNFYGANNTNNHSDYNIVVNIRQIIVTPDMQATPAIRTESKTIQDGWNYALDAKGIVKKDSSGNDIKTPKYKTIQCIITEYMQQKSSTIAGTLDFYNSVNNTLIYSYPFSSNQLFQHQWATANGDLNALSKASSLEINSGPAPYPSEIDMLLRAGEDLKLQVSNTVRDKIELVRN